VSTIAFFRLLAASYTVAIPYKTHAVIAFQLTTYGTATSATGKSHAKKEAGSPRNPARLHHLKASSYSRVMALLNKATRSSNTCKLHLHNRDIPNTLALRSSRDLQHFVP
jgi:hypothetical protein